MGASPRSRAGLAPLLLLVPPVLLALQFLVSVRLWAEEERDAAVAFTVISVEPERRSTGQARGASAGREGAEEGLLEDGARAYEEANETHERQVGPRVMEMQPWAVSKPSFSAELGRIITYITRPQINFLYADLLSAEWRLFQNWIEAGTLQNIHHLVATVHLHWAGFEVGGSDEEVLRYWFSVLRGLGAAGLHLVHSSSGEDHGVLKRTVESAHSSYTLSWVNTRR